MTFNLIAAYFQGFNDDEIVDFVKLTETKNICVRFIEYMPFNGNKWEVEKMLPYKDMIELIKMNWPGFYPLPNAPNDVSKVKDDVI